MEQNFREMVQATIQKDMQELLNGPIKQTHDIIGQVYEMGLMKGLELQRKNLQFVFAPVWISAEDKLPEIGYEVLFVRKDRYMYLGHRTRRDDGGWVADGFGVFEADSILCWMDIPKCDL